MTPSEGIVLTYLAETGIVSDSQIQNQCAITAGALQTIMRSLKTKLLVQQDGRYYRATEKAVEALRPSQPHKPFTRPQV